MGYTHYFKTTAVNADAFAKASNLFKDLVPKIEAMGIKLCNGHGCNEPIITDSEIIFNGDASKGLDCEAFYVVNDGMNEFCKTKHRPYDLAVCVALICLKIFMQDELLIETDGEPEDWQDALDLFADSAYTEMTYFDIIAY